jgi:hypothetical protein
MPQFEINYAQGVPSVVSMPRANMNVDTGAGDIGRAVSGFGGAMFEVGQKIQMAQDAMDLSILNQTGEKMDLDAELALSKITDAEEQAKFIQKHEADRANLSSKSNNRIQNAYQINYNNTSGDRLRRMTSVGMQTRAKDAQDKFKFARQTAVDNGNLLEVHKIDNLALATENIGPEQHKVLTDSAPIDIEFARAGKLLGTNPVMAESMMSDQEFLKKLNPEQTREALRLQGVAQRQAKENSDNAEINVMTELHKNRKASSVERRTVGEQMLATLPKSGISAERYGVMLNRIEDFQDGVDLKSDPLTFTTIRTEIMRAKSTLKDLSVMRGKVYENTDKLSTDDYENLIGLIDNKMGKMQAFALSSLTDRYIRENGGKAEFANVPEFQIAMEQWVEEHPTAGFPEIINQGNTLMTEWSNKTPEEILAEITGQAVPTAEELRREGTEDSYNKGVELGYW